MKLTVLVHKEMLVCILFFFQLLCFLTEETDAKLPSGLGPPKSTLVTVKAGNNRVAAPASAVATEVPDRFACIGVTSLEYLVKRDADARAWEQIAARQMDAFVPQGRNASVKGAYTAGARFNHGQAKRFKGFFIDLKAYLASQYIRSEWNLRMDVDSVFIRHVKLGDHLHRLNQTHGIQVVRKPTATTCTAPNGKPKKAVIPRAQKDDGDCVDPQSTCAHETTEAGNVLLGTSDANAYGFSISAFWVYESAAFARFRQHVVERTAAKGGIVRWALTTQLFSMLVAHTYPRFLTNIDDPFQHRHTIVESEALIADLVPTLAGKCPWGLHVQPHIVDPQVQEDVARMLRSLGGGLPTWIMQDTCNQPRLLQANLNVIRHATNVFMVTIARGCERVLRSPSVLNSFKPVVPPPSSPTVGGRYEQHPDVAPDRTDGLCPAQRVSIVVPLHYNDAVVLRAFLQSAKEFLLDIGSVSLHLIVTDDVDIERLRAAGLRDFARDWIEQRVESLT